MSDEENLANIAAVYDRLEQIAKTLGVKISNIGDYIGTNLRIYKKSNIGLVIQGKLEKMVGINPEFLMFGSGDMFLPDSEEIVEQALVSMKKMTKLPPNVSADIKKSIVINKTLETTKEKLPLHIALRPDNVLGGRPTVSDYSKEEICSLDIKFLEYLRDENLHLLNRVFETIIDLKEYYEKDNTIKNNQS